MHIAHLDAHAVEQAALGEEESETRGTLSFSPPRPQAHDPHWPHTGLERADTYSEAVLGLPFLCRLGRGRRDAPFPRGTGSSGKLKRRDRTSEGPCVSQNLSASNAALGAFYNGEHCDKELPERMGDVPTPRALRQMNCQRCTTMHSHMKLTLYPGPTAQRWVARRRREATHPHARGFLICQL